MPDESQEKRRIDVEINARTTGARQAADDLSHVKDGLLEGVLSFIRSGKAMDGVITGLGGALRSKFIGPLGIALGTIFGIIGGFKLVGAQLDTVARGVRTLSRLELYEKQFQPLLKGAAAAKDRVSELFAFAARTPFRINEVAEANKNLELLTRGALSGTRSMEMIGNAASVSGNDFRDVAFWFGRLYDNLKNGRPIGEVSYRLQEMGIFSGELNSKLEQMQNSGADFGSMWTVVERELSRSDGAMKEASQTMEGLQSTLEDTRDQFAASFGKPFLEAEKQSIRTTIAALEAGTPAARAFADVFALIKIPFQNTINKAGEFLFTMKSAPTVISAVANAAAALTAGLSVAQGVRIFGFLQKYNDAVVAMNQNRVSSGTPFDMFKSIAGGGFDLINILASVRVKIAEITNTSISTAGIVKSAFTLVASGIGNAFKALWGVIAANPIAIAVGAMAFGLYKAYQNSAEIVEAIKQIREATRDVTDSLQLQIITMRSIDDRQKAILEGKRAEIAAQEKLNRLVADGEDAAIVKAQRDSIAAIKAKTRDVESVPADSLAPSAAALDRINQMSDIERKARDERRDAMIEQASGLERQAALAAKVSELGRRENTAKSNEVGKEDTDRQRQILSAETERAKKELELTRERLSQSTGETGPGAAKRFWNGLDKPNTNLAQSALDEARRVFIGHQVVEKSAALESGSERTRGAARAELINSVFSRRAELLEKIRQKQTLLTDGTDIRDKDRREMHTSIEGMEDEIATIDKLKSKYSNLLRGVTPENFRLKAAEAMPKGTPESSTDLHQQRLAAENQLEATAAQTKRDELVARTQTEAATKIARVRELGVNGARQEADIRMDALKKIQTAELEYADKMDNLRRNRAEEHGGLTEDQEAAMRKTRQNLLADQQKEREELQKQNREREHQVYLARKDQSERLRIEEATADVRFGRGSARNVERLEDKKTVTDRAAQLKNELGINEGDAMQRSERELRANLLNSAQIPQVVADSLQSIGGGGGYYAGGTDPQMAVQTRMADLQEQTVEILADIRRMTNNGGLMGQ